MRNAQVVDNVVYNVVLGIREPQANLPQDAPPTHVQKELPGSRFLDIPAKIISISPGRNACCWLNTFKRHCQIAIYSNTDTSVAFCAFLSCKRTHFLMCFATKPDLQGSCDSGLVARHICITVLCD